MTRIRKDSIGAKLSAFKEAVEEQRVSGMLRILGRFLPRKVFCGQLAKFTDHELLRLTPDRRVDLMKVIYWMATSETTKPPNDVDGENRMMSLLTRVYTSMQPDPVYAQHMRQQRRKFQEILAGDRWLVEMRKREWDHDVAARPYFLKHLMVQHNHAMSHESLLFQACGLHYGVEIKGGVANYDNNEISFKGHWKNPDFTLRQAMRALLHENTHAHQDQMATAFVQDLLLSNSPFYQRGGFYAEFFKGKKSESFYVQPTKNRAAYRAHPIEREARMAERIVDVVEQRLRYDWAVFCDSEPPKIKRLGAGRSSPSVR